MTYNKHDTYKGYTFNIKVELETKIEKTIDGKRFHTVTLNDMGHTNYYNKQETETYNLEEIINCMIDDAHKWVDNRENAGKSSAEIILTSLGFK